MKRLCLILTLILTLSLVTACGGGGYADAGTAPPDTWASYTCHDLTFRFMAGWQTCSSETLQTEMENAMDLLGGNSHLTIVDQLVSPVTDKGTKDYLTLSYYTMTEEVTGETLETIMEDLNDLEMSLETAKLLQKSRIRLYGKELTALTICIKQELGNVICVSQIALVPDGNRLYQITYSDFSTGEDDSTLEQLLTGLVLPEK